MRLTTILGEGRMKLVKLTKTCSGCPAQWEGTLEDGRMVYIRYRWGWLSVSVSESKTQYIDAAVVGKTLFYEAVGPEMHGFLEFEVLAKLTGHILDYSDIEED